MPYKPALLHDSRIMQEFQRLAAYLNGTGGSTPAVTGTLSILGTFRVYAVSGGANAGIAGNGNSRVRWDDATDNATGVPFVQITSTQIEFTRSGHCQATVWLHEKLTDTTAATAVAAYMTATTTDAPYALYYTVAPSLAAGQDTNITGTTMIFHVDPGDLFDVYGWMEGLAAETYAFDSQSTVWIHCLA